MRFHPGSPAQFAKELEQLVPHKPVIVDFTLTANVTSSTLSNNAIRPTSGFSMEPITANVAAERGGTAMYHATPTLGQVVINHANNAQTDRTFRITIHNG
jgi:hypothetical protein